jgi:hypothetical protein
MAYVPSVPIGATAVAILLWLFPRFLWNEPAAKTATQDSIRHALYKRLDILGTILLLGSCLLLTTGLQQAALGYSFRSAYVLPLLICAGPFCVAFFTWQWYLTTRRSLPEPVFPWRFCQDRIQFGTIL